MALSTASRICVLLAMVGLPSSSLSNQPELLPGKVYLRCGSGVANLDVSRSLRLSVSAGTGQRQPFARRDYRALLDSCSRVAACSGCETSTSYLRSCDDLQVQGCKICAFCQNEGGQRVYSCTDTSNGCKSIRNMSGILTCS